MAPLALVGCTDPLSPPDEDTGSGTTMSGPADGTSTPTPPPDPSGDGTGTTGPGTTSSSGSADDNDPDDDGPPPIKLDVSGMPDASDGHCPVISVESEPIAVPADIIIAVDTSGSMGTETAAVQANLNMFSQQIVDAGVDARVVLISAGPGGGALSICIDPPLGGGGCPLTDDNEPLFLHVDQYVGSTNAYQQILDTYPLYQQVLRTEAVKQLLIVTDDNSFMTPAMFDAQFLALDITHFGYTQHGIVSMVNCPAAAQVGQAYMDLAAMTGGTIGDLCLQDFQPVFDQLALAVVDNSVPCTYDLPQTSGLYDATTAEVEIDLGEGPVAIPSVASPDMCPAGSDAWFFDDPVEPTKIIFCPYTCLQIKQSEEASVEVGVTCATG